ncbi:GNAT family N-acetyltransferase [Streptomyces ureilyticus]|jgi:ribosomal protein S18 acetylase RimI-like enzyme|uniref:GNAT family N-acetyltransferase n=1 Tax=Streptomyces ureilyticus TaxID=1775131 RepID=A0ABX0DHB6_9ACTN|nr:GNAT family N-acetyltransferase [Streptomyces ureilyticus]NGO40957.1 GNAT family N-acetyltransferase [Streptomyces ureilyticus]
MTAEQHPTLAASLQVGAQDDELQQRLDDELTAFNAGESGAGRPTELSVRVTDTAGELVGGLTGWTWGTLCAVEMLWVREDQRRAGWGARILRAAEEEGARRGCIDAIVSSYTFQAPGFYRAQGYRETGRLTGVPGGHEDVYFHKSLAAS